MPGRGWNPAGGDWVLPGSIDKNDAATGGLIRHWSKLSLFPANALFTPPDIFPLGASAGQA